MGFVFGGKLNFGLAFEMPKISIGCFVNGFFLLQVVNGTIKIKIKIKNYSASIAQVPFMSTLWATLLSISSKKGRF